MNFQVFLLHKMLLKQFLKMDLRFRPAVPVRRNKVPNKCKNSILLEKIDPLLVYSSQISNVLPLDLRNCISPLIFKYRPSGPPLPRSSPP